jgi:hypothetical protein
METTFNIVISIRTTDGLAEVGSFSMGGDADFARETFEALSGDRNELRDPMIRIDLVRREDAGLPVLLSSVACTLDEYTENCRVIVRDVFKYYTLGA